jgi:hypothetical protein
MCRYLWNVIVLDTCDLPVCIQSTTLLAPTSKPTQNRSSLLAPTAYHRGTGNLPLYLFRDQSDLAYQ